MKISWLVLVGITLTLSFGSFAADNTTVTAPGAQVQRLINGFSFTEGPAVDADGNVFFTDQPNNRIMKWSKDGVLSTFLSPCGRANGLYFDRDGNLWACADDENELWKIDPNGVVTVVIENFKGKLLNGPNDLWIMRNGCIYFTDPLFNRSWWDHRSGKELVSGQHVYFYDPNDEKLTQVTDDLQQPNGIIGTPDGRFLYVADYGGGKTYRYSIHPDGTLSGKMLFCSQGSDGMTIDEEGNLYLTGSGVAVYNKLGKKIQQINVSEGTANVTFGGPDNKTLYITARTSLYAIQMRVAGAMLLPNFNSDDIVNFEDYKSLANSWKQDDPNVDLGPTTLGDGIIDLRDLAILADNWLSEILPMELRANWKLDEQNGDIAHDSIASLDATVTGNMVWLPNGGIVDGAFLFDGIENYITTPFVLNPNDGAISIYAWIKGGAPGQVIISQKGSKNILSADASTGYIMAEIKGLFRGTKELVSETVITDGDWHHVGFVYDGTYRTLYVDGTIAAIDTSVQGPLTSSTNGFYIGAGKGLEAGTLWEGIIDDVRVYDSAIVPK